MDSTRRARDREDDRAALAAPASSQRRRRGLRSRPVWLGEPHEDLRATSRHGCAADRVGRQRRLARRRRSRVRSDMQSTPSSCGSRARTVRYQPRAQGPLAVRRVDRSSIMGWRGGDRHLRRMSNTSTCRGREGPVRVVVSPDPDDSRGRNLWLRTACEPTVWVCCSGSGSGSAGRQINGSRPSPQDPETGTPLTRPRWWLTRRHELMTRTVPRRSHCFRVRGAARATGPETPPRHVEIGDQCHVEMAGAHAERVPRRRPTHDPRLKAASITIDL